MKTTPLDSLEMTAGGLRDLGNRVSAYIELSREKFEQIRLEILEEYGDAAVMTREKIYNQLSNSYSLLLHDVYFLFVIID